MSTDLVMVTRVVGLLVSVCRLFAWSSLGMRGRINFSPAVTSLGVEKALC